MKINTQKSLPYYESEQLKSQWTEKWPQENCRLATFNQIYTMKNLVEKKRNEVDKHIYELCESNCYECNTKDEVDNNKEKSVVEKADLIIKKDMTHKEMMREKKKIWKVRV